MIQIFLKYDNNKKIHLIILFLKFLVIILQIKNTISFEPWKILKYTLLIAILLMTLSMFVFTKTYSTVNTTRKTPLIHIAPSAADL